MYGPMQSLPYSLILGLAVLIGWVVNEKHRFKQFDVFVVLLILFILWISFTTFNAVFPEPAFVKWDRTYKILSSGVLLALMLNSRARVEAFLWSLAIIFGLLAFRSAIRTIGTGGGGGLIVIGIGGFLTDRNVLAICLAMAFPLMLCLGKYSHVFPRNRIFSITVFSGAAASVIGLLGTQSRGGILSLAMVTFVMLTFTKRKVVAWLLAAIVIPIVLLLAPDEVWERMSTLKQYDQESSAAGRIEAWRWAWKYFLNNPLGGGFGVFRLNSNVAANSETSYLEAHSTYFEILAENGAIGTGIFLLLMLLSAMACLKSLRQSRKVKDTYVERVSEAVMAMLAGLYLGSAFLSLSTSPLFFYMFVLCGRLHVMLPKMEQIGPKNSKSLLAKTKIRNAPSFGNY